MLIQNLRTSSAIEVVRYRDFDQFRHATRIIKADSIPLETKGFSAVTATLRLPGCTIHVQRTFPRMIDALLEGGALVIFTMADVSPVKINGVDVEYPALALGRGVAGYRATEWHARTYALLVFDAPVVDRGWPDFDNALRVFRITPDMLAALQRQIRAMFEFASENPDHVSSLVRTDMREQVLAGLDAAFARAR